MGSAGRPTSQRNFLEKSTYICLLSGEQLNTYLSEDIQYALLPSHL